MLEYGIDFNHRTYLSRASWPLGYALMALNRGLYFHGTGFLHLVGKERCHSVQSTTNKLKRHGIFGARGRIIHPDTPAITWSNPSRKAWWHSSNRSIPRLGSQDAIALPPEFRQEKSSCLADCRPEARDAVSPKPPAR